VRCPDVRDGLKPVHRRVLYAMYDTGNTSDKPYKKSARAVGTVIGKYHPHGDQAVYDTIVRLAQDFSMRYTLVDGQGNFGSVDGDPPAAMRYTEIRLDKIAHEMLRDIEKETVDFGPNYDGAEEEPLVLPAALPNLLVNGSSGIAVGMATNIPPHNIVEVIEAIKLYVADHEVELSELMKVIPVRISRPPGVIYGVAGIRQAYETGRGRIIMRAVPPSRSSPSARTLGDRSHRASLPGEQGAAHRGDRKPRPRQEDRGDLGHPRRIGSRRHSRRLRAKKDENAGVILNNLYKFTKLQSTVRRDQPRDRARPAAGLPLKDMLRTSSISGARCRSPDAVRAQEGRGACPHPRRAEDRDRQPR
jgi:DNA gyrase subunit A